MIKRLHPWWGIGLTFLLIGLLAGSLAPAGALAQTTGLYPTQVRAIRVRQNVNVRSGPSTQYSRVGRYTAGQVVDVFGTNARGTWWNVRCPDGSVGNCWVTAEPNTTQPVDSTGPMPGSASRIQFPPGGTGASVRGNVQAANPVRYVLRALAGQQMTVQLFSPGGQANFAVQGVSDGQPYKRLENEDRSFVFTLPATQDYLITVATAGSPAIYELRVAVVSTQPPTSQPIRIQFPAGGTTATVNGLVRPPEQPRYVLRALAGQEMTVQISSPGNLANFAITGVNDGQAYKRLVNEARTFRLTLPTTQDYWLTVASTAGAVDYALTVSVVWLSTPPPGEPIRVQFAPGATSAMLSGNLFSGARQDYLVRALAGQTLSVELYADTTSTALAVSGADGTLYKPGSVGGPSFRFTLPATQDYRLSVVAAGGGSSYTLVVRVE